MGGTLGSVFKVMSEADRATSFFNVFITAGDFVGGRSRAIDLRNEQDRPPLEDRS